MDADLKRLLGIGQGTLADKEREHQARIDRIAADRAKLESNLTKQATIGAVVTILDND